jgi:SAM-dependent methyltransferase
MNNQSLEFWRGRIAQAKQSERPIDDAMAVSFDWDIINPLHKELLAPYITEGTKVLDVGCGYGRVASWWDNYVGIDFVPEFIEEARKRNPGKDFRVLDLKEPLPFADKEFDVAVLISVKGVIMGAIGEEAWAKIETELKRVSKKVLSLCYGMNREADIRADFEIIL